MKDSWDPGKHLKQRHYTKKCVAWFCQSWKKKSKLATLGELGQYPLWKSALELTLKYEWHLSNRNDENTIISSALIEMHSMSAKGEECWLTRVNQAKALLNLPAFPSHCKDTYVNRTISRKLKSSFDRYWLDRVNRVEKNGCSCPNDHNKLRVYKQFKGSFTVEPYIELVRNRNQRCFLTRYRISSHFLRVETGRWTFPKTKFEDRICLYCDSNSVDSELHFITECSLTQHNRGCFYRILESFDTSFKFLNNLDKFKHILCPVDSVRAKLSNKYLGLLEKTRICVDQGKPIDTIETICLTEGGIGLISSDIHQTI